MLPERLILPSEVLSGAYVINDYPCERHKASLEGSFPLAAMEFGLTIFDLSDGRRVFVCTELADNPGRSVTNAWPELAAHLVDAIGDTTREKTVFIEHYWPGSYESGMREETFDQVLIDWKELRVGWRRLAAEMDGVA